MVALVRCRDVSVDIEVASDRRKPDCDAVEILPQYYLTSQSGVGSQCRSLKYPVELAVNSFVEEESIVARAKGYVQCAENSFPNTSPFLAALLALYHCSPTTSLLSLLYHSSSTIYWRLWAELLFTQYFKRH